MKNKNKISLLKDIKQTMIKKESLENYQKHPIMDERVVAEKNKVMSAAYNILVFILVISSIIGETNNLKINTAYVFMIIGLISYSMLLILCKKMAIKENEEAFTLFVWSFITLPLSLYTIILDFISTEWFHKQSAIFLILFTILSICTIIVIPYKIANFVYKYANKQE